MTIKQTLLLAALAVLYATPPAVAAAPVPAERALYTDAPNGMFLLDSGWTTRSDPTDTGVRDGWFQPGASAGFTDVSIPNAFNAGDLSRKSFNGSVQWYRAEFTQPQVSDLAEWHARFESVNTEATVWLNGTKIGDHRGAYLPFELRLDPAALQPADNELVIRVDSRGRPSDLPPSNRPRGWWNFGGILREVYLRAVRSLDLTDLHVTAAPGNPARAHITATVKNASAAALPAPIALHVAGPGIDQSVVTDPATIAPGQSRAVAATIGMRGARSWSPAHPNLYELTAQVPGGETVTAHFGVRSWRVSKSGRILLNGRPLTLRGASFHEQTPQHGAALTEDDRATIVQELQSIHANFAREHYPPHPALLEAFDRAGIVYWEQVPLWRVRAAQLRNAGYRATALAALRAAILRDRNHASVLAWSISNETLRGGKGEIAYIQAARRLLNSLDKTRLLAADKAMLPLGDLPRSYRLLDAIGLNEYLGWYGSSTRDLPNKLRSVHHRFPHQALVITEFGAEANRTGTAKGSYSFQRKLLASHLSIFDRTPFLSGALAWVLRDFAVRPGWTGGNPHPQPPILFKGLFKQDGSPKPAVQTIRSSYAKALS